MSGNVRVEAGREDGLDSAQSLAPPHLTSYRSIVQDELTRYPVTMQQGLPDILLLDTAQLDGQWIRARYLPERNLGVLTPQLDLRGNIHRVVASSLLHGEPDGASLLRAAWADLGVNESGHDACLYSRDALSPEGEIAATIAAIVINRPTLVDLGTRDPHFAHRLDLARQFLGLVGMSELTLADLPIAPPYAYLSTVSGEFPRWEILPGGVQVDVLPRVSELPDNYSIEPLTRNEADHLPAGVLSDIWLLPELVLSEVLTAIHIVSDVRRDDCDVAGVMYGSNGQAGRIVVEADGRRPIFCHELGHAIHRRFANDFPEADWRSYVPPDGYIGSAAQYIKSGLHEPDYSPSLLERGFVTGYSTSTLNEDVAEIFDALLRGDPRLWTSMPDFARISAKVDCLISFLHRVDPTFNRGYFEAIAHQRDREENGSTW